MQSCSSTSAGIVVLPAITDVKMEFNMLYGRDLPSKPTIWEEANEKR